MRYRETVTALALTGALTACSGGAETDTAETTPSVNTAAPESTMPFLEYAKDADYFQSVNCDADPNDSAAVGLVNPRGDVVSLTLGETDYAGDLQSQAVKYLGGATIYAVGGQIYNIARSDMPGVNDIDTSQKNYRAIIPIEGKDFSVAVGIDNGVASIECEPKVEAPTPTTRTDI